MYGQGDPKGLFSRLYDSINGNSTAGGDAGSVNNFHLTDFMDFNCKMFLKTACHPHYLCHSITLLTLMLWNNNLPLVFFGNWHWGYNYIWCMSGSDIVFQCLLIYDENDREIFSVHNTITNRNAIIGYNHWLWERMQRFPMFNVNGSQDSLSPNI